MKALNHLNNFFPTQAKHCFAVPIQTLRKNFVFAGSAKLCFVWLFESGKLTKNTFLYQFFQGKA